MSERDDRSKIERLIIDYAYFLDTGDIDAVAELFADATLRVFAGGQQVAEATGSEQVRALLGLHADHGGAPATHHATTNIRIDVAGDTATARSYITLFQATEDLPLQPVACGHYRDVFVRDPAGPWRWKERRNEARLVGDLSRRLRADVTAEVSGLAGLARRDTP